MKWYATQLLTRAQSIQIHIDSFPSLFDVMGGEAFETRKEEWNRDLILLRGVEKAEISVIRLLMKTHIATATKFNGFLIIIM